MGELKVEKLKSLIDDESGPEDTFKNTNYALANGGSMLEEINDGTNETKTINGASIRTFAHFAHRRK